MKFTYMQTPLNRYTFKNSRIKKWVEDNIEGKVLNLFAGKIKLKCDEVRNDIDPDALADYQYDALEFCRLWNKNKFDTILLDPPYSYRKSMEMYGGKITSPFNALKDEIMNILYPGGIVITFGYHSNSMGKNRNFKIEHIMLMSHGGAIHDTVVTIERFGINQK
jgi:hypothetical protein